MDNAISAAAGDALNTRGMASVNAGGNSALERLNAIPLRTLITLAVAALAVAALIVGLVVWSRESSYRVLFANLSDKDGGAIVGQLSQMNIPYRHADGGTAILVPSDKVHDARLRLASQGLPKGSVVGLELMDAARFGQTQFQERLTFQRGLEGELTRSIMSLGSVQAARVHLALPQQNSFFRDQQKPSASVLLSLYPGRSLDRTQLAGIVHLVSASVPELSPKAVSVLDQTGALLSGAQDNDSARGLDAQQLQYVQQVESSYHKRVMEILEPVVGKGNLRATVTAEIDFSQSESTSEQFRPNQGESPASIRSVQQSESSSGNAGNPAGVPGPASNQPAPQAGAAAAAPGAAQAQLRKDNITNFEVDKTVRVVRNATGTVRRINAAVVLNHRSSTDAKGKTVVTPPSDEELQKYTSLVQESIGFSKERGDSVKVVGAPFHVPPELPVEEVPIWKQTELIDTLKGAVMPVIMVILAFIVFFGIIRPAMRQMATPVRRVAISSPVEPNLGFQLDASVDERLSLQQAQQAGGSASAGSGAAAPGTRSLVPAVRALPPPELEPEDPPLNLEAVRTLAHNNPAAVANILSDWIGVKQSRTV